MAEWKAGRRPSRVSRALQHLPAVDGVTAWWFAGEIVRWAGESHVGTAGQNALKQHIEAELGKRSIRASWMGDKPNYRRQFGPETT